MPFFALSNLVSKSVKPCVPWEFSGTSIPVEVRGKGGKKERDKWISRPGTQHEVYTAFEGLNPNERISEGKGGDEGNPPLRCHAFVADIDAPLSEDELAAGIQRLGDSLIPNYYERTLSGNARLIWLFEAPVSFPNYRFAKEWLQIALDKMRLDSAFAGFDIPAFIEPNRTWTNSGDWRVIDADRRLPYELLKGWIVLTSEKHLWKRDKNAVEIPMPEIQAELAKKYPMHTWEGDFIEGAQGPTFWIEGSSSPKSAVVKSTGMFTFSAHAIKPFYPWADLVGAKFVEEYQTKMMGAAVAGIYHDGSSYYRTTGYGDWRGFAKEDIARHLAVDRGLSSSKNGDAPSQVDRAIQFIQNWQGIEGAAPFAFQPQGILKRSGGTFLNLHTRKVLAASSDQGVWGPKGNFPWLSKYLDHLFDPHEQLDFFLSWLSRFYRGAHSYELVSGQNMFLLGPAGVGKTLLSQGILPRLIGGGADAEDYLLGSTTFNSQLFDVALWTVDDNSATVDVQTHRKFSAMVKKMAANTTFSYHAKFRIPCTVEWLGRVLVTANDDEESARIVPDLTISILDKLMLFKTCRKPFEFPGRNELLGILDRELPYLASFLLHYKIPEHCQGTARYGVKSYHEASLMQTAEQSSRTAGFNEILEDWAQEFFSSKSDEKWEGTAWQLLKQFHNGDIAASAMLRGLSTDAVARHLMALKAKGWHIESTSGRNTRIWTIHRPEGNKAVILPTSQDKFSK